MDAGKRPVASEIDTEGELTVAYLAPTVELRNWLIEERMRDEVHVAEVHGQVTYQPWKLPAEMNADRMRERKRWPWVKVFKSSLLAAKWMRGAVEHFFGPIVSEQRLDDEQREYVKYVLDGPMRNPLKSSVAVAIGPYSFEEVRVVTSETPFCEVCFTHGHMGLHGRCLTPAETLQEMHEREMRSIMDPILQSNPQEERRAWHELELQVDDALLKEARIAAQTRKEAASQACHEERRRKPAKGRGRYCRNVLWEGRGDDPMQTDDPHWLFGEDRKRKAEQGPEQEKGSKTGSSRQEQGTGGDQRERDAEASSAKPGKEVGEGGQTQSSEGTRGAEERGETSRQKEGQEGTITQGTQGQQGNRAASSEKNADGGEGGGRAGLSEGQGGQNERRKEAQADDRQVRQDGQGQGQAERRGEQDSGGESGAQQQPGRPMYETSTQVRQEGQGQEQVERRGEQGSVGESGTQQQPARPVYETPIIADQVPHSPIKYGRRRKQVTSGPEKKSSSAECFPVPTFSSDRVASTQGKTMGQETSGRQASSQTSQTRPKCTRERHQSPLGTKGYEPRYSLRGKGKRNESPPPSGSVPLKEPSFGLPAEGVGDQSSCQEDDNSLESSTTETSDSSEDDQQSVHRSANQQQQDCSAEGGAQGSASQQQQERSVEEEHHTSQGQGSEEGATPAEVASAENRSTQEQESQQRQQPESQLEGLARQERVGARLPDILRAGEGYVCPIVLWQAPEEIRLLLEGATDVPTFGVARPPREQQVLKKVAEWLGPRYEVVTMPQISALRFVRETAGGDEYVIFVFFVEAIPKSRIDMIWASGELNETVEQVRIVPMATSDHSAVIATFPVGRLEDIWSHVQSRLNLAETCKLEEDITEEEVVRAIAELPRLKTPGLDGMPVELYKELRNFFGVLLTAAYNEAVKGGTLPQGFADAYVVLLFKKGAKEDVRNWRPISILNALYKILAKVLANRLKEVLPSIIDSTQTGFVAGRQILSKILLAQQILEEEQCTGQALAFLSIDLEKAYDRVRWEFLLQSMA
ncbi:hypothetical protein CBR_g20405 [Chara braunii]|uniref:Reverse transcriptase domain-containing protein n=1 Tax=Chara braunii TaxID=69332 RepID=A0A388JU93_CHABU|nr:hypothetical protein CBR_g20405 [Chara braunii]|eukprot:GBG61374.1 hypothetical protein CBR_g20405 [Chara braunii]